MKKLLFIALSIVAEQSIAGSWSKLDGWGSNNDIANTNREMRIRAENDARKSDELKKKWDEEEPAREARRKEREMLGLKNADPVRTVSAPTTADGNASDSLVDACVNKYRPWLKDPRSLYVVSSNITNGKLVIDGRAKNSFGGYVPGTYTCALSGDAIDDSGTEVYLAMFRLGIN